MKNNKWRKLAINYKNLSLPSFKLGKRNLISADLYKNIIYRYFDEFKFISQKRLSSKDFNASYMEARAFSALRYRGEVANLDSRIISYAYEELLLNPTKEYKISYYKNLDDSYSIFVIDMELALNGLKNSLKSLPNIDIMIPSPLLMSGFYSSGLVDKSKVDCYIFLDQNESYMSFYKDGEYIFHHPIITDSLALIAGANSFELSIKAINQNIDKFDEFIKMSIETLKSIANIDKIIPQRLFLSSFLGDLSELNRELSNHLNISVNGFSFLDKFGGKKVINLMIAIYAKELMAKRLKADFRIFQRAKPLHQRADGKLIISLVAGAILGMIYPIYMLILALNLDLKRENLKADLSIQNASLNSLNSDLALINNQLENLLKDKQNIKDNINLNLSKIDKISNKINNQNLAIILSNITKSMQTHSLKAREIKLQNQKLIISIVSPNTKNINDFIKAFESIADISQIVSNKNLFESNITIGLKYGI